MTVADVYDHPALADLAAALDDMQTPSGRQNAAVLPVPVTTQAAQVLASLGFRAIGALRWLTWVGVAALVGRGLFGLEWLPDVAWGWVLLGWLLLVLPVGRVTLGAAAARVVLTGVRPGTHRRGGTVHLRLWLAERLVDELGATSLSSAPLVKVYARLLGCHVGRHVDLHSVPPVTGLLTLGDGCSVEPEVDLAGHWLDGGHLHIGEVRVGAGARVGARSTLLPGADVGTRAEVAPGSAVFGGIPDDEAWSGAPALPSGAARGPWGRDRPPNRPGWLVAYTASAVVLSLLPVLAVLVGLAVALPALRRATSIPDAVATAAVWLPLSTVVGFTALALLVLAAVRLLSLGLEAGPHPVYGRQAWQAWSILRVLDEARTWLFPLYSSALTPAWLRALGADIGAGRGGLHGADDPLLRAGRVGRLPRRRHPRRRVRARRRLATGGARPGRQGRVRRQLRDGRARAHGAEARAGGGAVRRAAAGASPRPAPRGSAAHRARCAASRTRGTPPAPTRRLCGCGSRGPRSRCAGSCRSGRTCSSSCSSSVS